ncbi:MAG: nucleotide exchange factor GrpE [Planctomycetota bacterium]
MADKEQDETQGVDESAFAETLSADDLLPGEEPADGESSESDGANDDGPTVEEELAGEKDRSLRLQAELQNVLARASREVADERKYAALPLLKDLLPAIDTIDRALEAAAKAAGEADAATGVVEGFRLVREQLVGVLAQHSCEAVDPTGESFDPNFHEAILQQPSDEHAAGVVTQTAQIGYRLHDRVIRPAQVIVSSGAP